MLVIDKPTGIAVHPGPGGGDNLERYFDELRFGLPKNPCLAHRLDRDTSGCLILGRHRKALSKLGKLFTNGRIEKTYWAIVEGKPAYPEGTIDLPLKKQTEQKNRWWMMTHPEGMPSVTEYKLLKTNGELSLLELYPLTGRTHQIRVHCAAIGCPLVGDMAYNPQAKPGQKIFLHSRQVVVPLYPSRDPVIVAAPPPLEMENFINKL
jgi:tRNA pseudouridine32 synthase/23S rRNA pseudouridine746 synthase